MLKIVATARDDIYADQLDDWFAHILVVAKGTKINVVRLDTARQTFWFEVGKDEWLCNKPELFENWTVEG